MTAALPAFTDYEPFRAFRADPAQWLPNADDIARGHGLACSMPHVFATGTNLVLALDEKLILKIFPPFLRGQFASERSTLAQLRGKLRIAIPEIVVEGERDGWPYLVITRLSGVLGAEAWPALPEQDKERLLAEIGETIAQVQRVPAGTLADRAKLGRLPARTDRGMPRTARAFRIAAEISGWAGRAAVRRRGVDCAGRAAGDSHRRIYSGEFPAEP
jgi:aminoglycoside phosphotransferase (APT) family kinase protein